MREQGALPQIVTAIRGSGSAKLTRGGQRPLLKTVTHWPPNPDTTKYGAAPLGHFVTTPPKCCRTFGGEFSAYFRNATTLDRNAGVEVDWTRPAAVQASLMFQSR